MPGEKASWGRLPAELQREILGYMPLLDVRGSQLAPVCEDWQSIIEPRNFAEIFLTVPRLTDPNSWFMLRRKRNYIRYILFQVHLQIYFPLFDEDQGQDRTIINAFERLFKALSSPCTHGDLVLGIDVRLPAKTRQDLQLIKRLTSRPEHWPDPIIELSLTRYTKDNINSDIIDLGHFPNEESEMHWWRSLAVVPAVREVHLYRPAQLQWNPVALSSMFTRFPNMKGLSYEADFFPGNIRPNPEDFGTMLQSLAAKPLCKLAISPGIRLKYRNPEGWPIPDLSKKLARASLLHTELSAEFTVDAGDFFAARQEDWLWERLTSLTLTSKVLRNYADPEDVHHLLRDAAAAALNMPRLGTMELWNGEEATAMLFRYQKARDGQPAVITVGATAALPIEGDVLRAWEGVACQKRQSRLVVRTFSVDPDKIRGFADAKSELGISTAFARTAVRQPSRT